VRLRAWNGAIGVALLCGTAAAQQAVLKAMELASRLEPSNRTSALPGVIEAALGIDLNLAMELTQQSPSPFLRTSARALERALAGQIRLCVPTLVV